MLTLKKQILINDKLMMLILMQKKKYLFYNEETIFKAIKYV